MIIISHILRSVGYVTLLPYLAYAASESFATCMPNPGAQSTGVLLAAITFALIIGYGDILMKKLRGSAVRFWIASTSFHAGFAGLAIYGTHKNLLSSVKTILSGFLKTFIPEYQPYSALGAVGELTLVILTVWMPVAAILSAVALVEALCTSRHGTGPTVEKNGPEDPPTASPRCSP